MNEKREEASLHEWGKKGGRKEPVDKENISKKEEVKQSKKVKRSDEEKSV